MTAMDNVPAVFLDTEVFDKHSRDFECSNIRRLARLSSNGAFQVFLTSVTVQEVRAHLDQDAKKAFSALRNYRRASKLVKRVLPDPQFEPEDEQVFRVSLQEEFDSFIASLGIQVISVTDVSPEEVLNDYFSGVAPFATGDKKSEFPDAFAIAAIRKWRESQRRDVFVVSGDGDWKGAFKYSDTITYRPNLEAFLEDFVDAEVVLAIREFLESKRDDIVAQIRAEAMNLEYSITDDLWNGELGEYAVSEVNLDEFHVIEAQDGTAEVSIFCQIKVDAEVFADDSMSAYRDPDTKDVYCWWKLSGDVQYRFDAEVTLTLSYTGRIAESISIQKVEFDSKEVVIDAEDGDLSRVGDDEGYDSGDYEHE